MYCNQIICPVCNLPLTQTNNAKSVQCENGHLFDYAKQGYLNLLLSQQKKSKSPGDDLAMVKARTEFLNKRYYSELAEQLGKIAFDYAEPQLSQANNTSAYHYTDLACGEGYYTSRLHDLLTEKLSNQDICTTGIDISAPAIKAATKRTKAINWLIASAARAPLSASSQNLITGLFFHFNLTEVARLLKPQGSFITLNTGPKHLIELRSIIYDQIKDHKDTEFNLEDCDLHHLAGKQFETKITLSSSLDIQNLLLMTPHHWRIKQEKKDELFALNTLDLSLDLQFDIFVKA